MATKLNLFIVEKSSPDSKRQDQVKAFWLKAVMKNYSDKPSVIYLNK